MLKNIKMGPVLISILVVLGFIIVLVLLIMKPINIDEKVADVVKILVGALSAKFSDVVQYYMGSSAGSKSKDDILSNIVQNQPPAKP